MKTVKLGDVCEVVAGQSPVGTSYNDKGEGLEFHQGKKLFGENELRTSNVHTTKPTKIAEPGDILMSVRAPVGPVNYTNRKICIGRGLAAIRAGNEVDKSYLFHFLRMNEANINGTQGATFASINKKDIESILLPLPDVEEQRRIVARLDAAFEKISAAEVLMRQNLDNVAALQKSILHKYLSTSDSTHTHRLGDLCAVLGGKRLPKGEKLLNIATDYPYIRVADFDGRGSVDMSDVKYISASVYKIISRYIINTKDVFLSIAGTIGVTGIIPDELDGANLTENACRLVPSEVIDTRYLYYFTTSDIFRDQALAGVKQTAQPKLALMRIKDITINLPDIDIQKKVVVRLDDLLGKTRKLEAEYSKKLAKLDTLRQSLLQEAFSTTK